jgi:hypothetical protein
MRVCALFSLRGTNQNGVCAFAFNMDSSKQHLNFVTIINTFTVACACFVPARLEHGARCLVVSYDAKSLQVVVLGNGDSTFFCAENHLVKFCVSYRAKILKDESVQTLDVWPTTKVRSLGNRS